MARSDLLISLVRAGASGDRTMLRSTVEAMMAEERAKSHHTVADRLEKALQAVAITPPPFNPSRNLQGDGKDIILEITPSIELDDLIRNILSRR